MSAHFVATVSDAGNVSIIIPCDDEPTHTAENNYRCSDETCPCHEEEGATRS